MDEGVSNYVYYDSYRKGVREAEVAAFHKSQIKIAREALASGKWINLINITYMYDWNVAESTTPGLAQAEAYVAVQYLVETYGMEKCISTYQAVGHNGGSAETGMASIMGVTFEKLEAGIRDWLTAQPN